jgi:PAS domain S-box
VNMAAVGEELIAADVSGYLPRHPERNQANDIAAKVRDVAERYHDATTIEQTQERFRTIIEQSSDVVSVLDADGTYVYQSPSVEPTLGYSPDDFYGRRMYEFVHPDDRERVMSEFRTAVEGPSRTTIVEYRFQHDDGSWRVVESRATDMLDDPIVQGLVVNSRDITERRRRAQRMNVLNRTLRHDLRNNMNVILGNAELLMREHGSDHRAETIRSTAADMLELGNKVRDIEQALDTSEQRREMVDIVSTVEEHLAAVERSHPELRVERSLPESQWVLANRRIGSAIGDAVENAVQHNPAPDPRLRVAVETDRLAGDDAVTVTVADNGPGIPEEELSVLTNGGETPLEHASGLGLWLIKWIVTESGGEVTFEKSGLDGTAVRITLQQARAGQWIDV